MRKIQFSPTLLTTAILAALSASAYATKPSTDGVADCFVGGGQITNRNQAQTCKIPEAALTKMNQSTNNNLGVDIRSLTSLRVLDQNFQRPLTNVSPGKGVGTEVIIFGKKANVTTNTTIGQGNKTVLVGTINNALLTLSQPVANIGTGRTKPLTVHFNEGFSIDVANVGERNGISVYNSIRDMIRVAGNYPDKRVANEVNTATLISHEDASVNVKLENEGDIQYSSRDQITALEWETGSNVETLLQNNVLYGAYITDSGVLDARKNLNINIDAANSVRPIVGVNIGIHGDSAAKGSGIVNGNIFSGDTELVPAEEIQKHSFRGTLKVGGDLTVTANGDTYAGIANADRLEVGGNTTVTVKGDKPTNNPNVVDDNGVVVEKQKRGQAVRFGRPDTLVTNEAFESSSDLKGNLTIDTDRPIGLLMTNGEHTIGKTLKIDTSGDRTSRGFVATSGRLSAKKAEITTNTQNGHALVLGLSTKDEFPTLDDSLAKGAVLNFSAGETKALEANKQQVNIGADSVIKAKGESAAAIMALKGGEVLKAIDITNAGTVESEQSAGVNLALFANGLTGDYTTTTTNSGTIAGKETAFAGSSHKDSLTNAATGVLKGAVVMYEGDDTVELDGDISKVTKLIGSNQVGSSDTETNTLTLKNQTISGSSDSEGAVGNVKVLGWENVNLEKTTFDVTSDLKLNQDGKIGDFNIDADSTLAATASGKTLDYSIANEGTIDLTRSQNDVGGKLTLAGDYTGEAGSKLIVRTTWNNPDEQKSDTLIIKGAESGSTVVEVKNGILGDVTLANKDERKDGLKANAVVKVEGTATGQVFTGTAQTAGALEAQLYYDADKKVYYWVLDGQNPHNAAILPATAPVSNGAAIYAQPVSSYVQTQYANRLMGLDQLSRLHERVGEKSSDNNQTWVRIRHSDTIAQGKDRLGFASKRSLVQIGHDVEQKAIENGNRVTGVMMSYSNALNKFYDKYTTENGVLLNNPTKAQQYRSSVRSEMVGLQAYQTRHFNNGTYLDVVGGVIGVRNKFAQGTQRGYGLQASVEIGHAFPIRESNWKFEPQAQLSAQWLKYGGFSENNKRIEAGSDRAVQGRIGVRVHNDNFYFKADVIRDFVRPVTATHIGTDRVTETYTANRFNVGFGGELGLNADNSFTAYGDVKYTRSLDRGNSKFTPHAAFAEYSGEIGVRYRW